MTSLLLWLNFESEAERHVRVGSVLLVPPSAKFQPRNGHLRLRLRLRPLNAAVSVKGSAQGREVLIRQRICVPSMRTFLGGAENSNKGIDNPDSPNKGISRDAKSSFATASVHLAKTIYVGRC